MSAHLPETNPPTPRSKPRGYVNPFPDAGMLYLIVAGILLGVLLGPAVLGRLAPSVYQRAFVGGAEQAARLAEEQAKTQQQLEALEATGVTEAAIPEQLLARDQQLAVLKAELEQARRLRLAELVGGLSALTLAVIAVMLIESLISPDPAPDKPTPVPPALGRLITARYALAALWIALALAQPALLKQLPILFVALLVVVALAAALVPLGQKAG